MTRDEALDLDENPPGWRVQLKVATGTDGERWYRVFRYTNGEVRTDRLYRAPWGVLGRDVDLDEDALDPPGVDWMPGWIDPDPSLLPEHPAIPGYLRWIANSEAKILETSRKCREEMLQRKGLPPEVEFPDECADDLDADS